MGEEAQPPTAKQSKNTPAKQMPANKAAAGAGGGSGAPERPAAVRHLHLEVQTTARAQQAASRTALLGIRRRRCSYLC